MQLSNTRKALKEGLNRLGNAGDFISLEDEAHEDKEQIFTKDTGTGGSDGFRACGGVLM